MRRNAPQDPSAVGMLRIPRRQDDKSGGGALGDGGMTKGGLLGDGGMTTGRLLVDGGMTKGRGYGLISSNRNFCFMSGYFSWSTSLENIESGLAHFSRLP